MSFIQTSSLKLFIYFFLSLLQLAAIKLGRYGEDLLFYLYYMNGGDVLQLLAAVELYVQTSVDFAGVGVGEY